ncbi:hypothetical protein B9Z55_019326 [Caenorhabditis nigoni]|uniref:UPAR/Ly6 domain-containing protein n=1 Tax=Caenorhabditis nigoni TaxID=1611254 RepID=A0A2G5THV3_9PELO|nr:hypothetical protein B9Z55_019326 [Caenorhabditis nigoni]
MIRPIFFVLAVAAYSAYALQCHQVTAGNLSIPDTSQRQECVVGSLTCLKIVDYSRGTYSKQCQSMNCTNSAAGCTNSTAFGVTGATCCCYGDGCNSAPQTGIITAFGITAALVSLVKIIA